MSTDVQLGLNWGAHDGMKRAIAHAEREEESWGDRALLYLRAYLQHHPPHWRFITPDMRRWAVERGCKEPASNNAWGSVLYRARRLGLIVPDGYEQYGDGKMHTQPVRAWRAA